MCGDHTIFFGQLCHHAGSPPHVRGPLRNRYLLYTLQGITPACAGTTLEFSCSSSPSRDHPRMCGDHKRGRWKKIHRRGSPPHVRGPLMQNTEDGDIRGITPACAGTTLALCMVCLDWGDHPRMCGDHH